MTRPTTTNYPNPPLTEGAGAPECQVSPEMVRAALQAKSAVYRWEDGALAVADWPRAIERGLRAALQVQFQACQRGTIGVR